jgi:pimeloyl-ACP methyl ester carboxylesterase
MVLVAAAPQPPAVRAVDESGLREYTGVYQWQPDAFAYLQLWDEYSGFGKPRQLVAFDESGDVRVLYPTDRDRFFAGPGAAVNTSVESRIEFTRDAAGRIASLTWQRGNEPLRVARRAEIERREDVRFASGGLRLAGTLTSPATAGRHPAVILVHGSGAENRDYILPWARFLIRRGVSVFGYDKRGVGESAGDWNVASFDDLASDVAAAFEYLKTRRDIDPEQIGVIGVSQAGWVMPLAALRANGLAFLISISGAGVTAAETTLDQARNEMTMTGMPRQAVEEILALMKLQYDYARTGQGWDAYAAAREKIAARMGKPPDTIPGTPDHPYFRFIKQIYFYDPEPTLRRLQTPTLAIWGELDNNVVAKKNRDAWQTALEAGGNRAHTLVILPKANHALFEAEVGSNAEGPTLQRIVPAYFTTVEQWLAKRLRGFSLGARAHAGSPAPAPVFE